MSHGRLRLDAERFKVWWAETEVTLTVTEFGILRTLLRRPGKVYSREDLIGAAYDFHNVVSDSDRGQPCASPARQARGRRR